jgi:predicted RNA binding protein YcfA (HicA-like mRNA interferase family)
VTIPLPRLSAPELRRKLLRLGFVEDRQKGSHLILRHRDDPNGDLSPEQVLAR